MRITDLIELLVSLVFQISTVALAAKRRLWPRFPFYFLYIALAVPATLGRLMAVSHDRAYYYVFFAGEAVLVVLSLAALHQVFYWVFEGFYRLHWFLVFYWGTILVALGVAVRNAIINPPVHADLIASVILDVEIAVNFVRMGIVSLFIVFHKLLDLDFRRYAYGIVIGFGIISAGTLISFLAFSGFGPKVIFFARNAPAVAYILGLLVWVGVFARPEPEEEREPPMSPEQMLKEIQSYLRALGISRTHR